MNGGSPNTARVLVGILCLLLPWIALAQRSYNLYEWAGVAPVVLVGTSLGDNGKYHEFTVDGMQFLFL